jgi:hypothetical protein
MGVGHYPFAKIEFEADLWDRETERRVGGFAGLLCAIFAGPRGSVTGLEAHPLNALIATSEIGLNHSIKNFRFIRAASALALLFIRGFSNKTGKAGPGPT